MTDLPDSRDIAAGYLRIDRADMERWLHLGQLLDEVRFVMVKPRLPDVETSDGLRLMFASDLLAWLKDHS